MSANRLIDETSPYLLQHAHNPVDWFPWGPQALERAKRENRPILLSIGYSACHWCHVMERESFEDEAIAATMNENFVCVKVDREERPDIDEIYMQATLLLNRGQGGWPMTVFLTPEQEPFFAGTYFPPDDRHGRPGFPRLLQRIAEVWAEQPEALVEQAASLTEHLRKEAEADPAVGIGQAEIDLAVTTLQQQFDPHWGGFGGAPKFPPHQALLLLLRHHHRTGERESRQMVTRTLDAMAAGGMHDHIGGGFCRYSVDERWMVPHFEKMLYDNAQLVRAYLDAGLAFDEPRYLEIAREVLDYLLREMVSKEGGLYSATDADSEGVEGKFFVWTPDQVEQILGPQAARACVWFDIRPEGNFEGSSIPNTPRTRQEVATLLNTSAQELSLEVEKWRTKLYTARLERVPPGLDDKVLTGWNALAIGALAEGARVLGDSRYLEAARRAVEFIWNEMRDVDGRLLRTWRAGRAHLNAVLEDYAYLCEALIDLYEVDGDPLLLERAKLLAQRMLSQFVDDESGAMFSTSQDHETLLVRRRDGTDGATPNPSAVAASALARLSVLLDEPGYREAASRALQAHGGMVRRFPRAFVRSLIAVDWLLESPLELALIGDPADESYLALDREVARSLLPNRVIARGRGDGSSALPLLAGKTLVDGGPALYICRDYACQAPITDPELVAAALAGEAAERVPALADAAG